MNKRSLPSSLSRKEGGNGSLNAVSASPLVPRARAFPSVEVITTEPWLHGKKRGGRGVRRGRGREDKRSELEHFHRGGRKGTATEERKVERGKRGGGAFQISKGVQRYSAGIEGTKAEDPDGRDEVGFSGCVLSFPLSLSLSSLLPRYLARDELSIALGRVCSTPFPSSSWRRRRRGVRRSVHAWRERKLLHFRERKNRGDLDSFHRRSTPESNGCDGTTADTLPLPPNQRTNERRDLCPCIRRMNLSPPRIHRELSFFPSPVNSR